MPLLPNLAFLSVFKSELISTEIPIERRKQIYAKTYQMDLQALREANGNTRTGIKKYERKY